MRSILRGLCVPDKVADDVAYAPLQTIESIDGPIFSRLKQNAPKVTAMKPSKKVTPPGTTNAKTTSKKAA
jgi:hypothetical protein